MAEEEQGAVLEVENNSQETPTEEPTPITDPATEGTTVQADSGSDGITEGSAEARTKEQIGESERYHQSVNSKLKTTVVELQQRLQTLKPEKPVSSENGSQEKTSSDGEEDFINSEAQLEKVVGRVFDRRMQNLSSQAARNEQMRTIDETVLRFKADNDISDDTYTAVMKSYGPVVKREIEAGGDVTAVAEMFLETLANRAGLERDSQVVETAKVDAARKGKALQGVQKPATGGAPPTPAKETEGQKLLRGMQEAGGDKALSGFFASKKPA